eukprot:TRINITY_DN10740_c0_g1_i2.p1 TRINITY_DN10740_c0_g1~~TRINITY_DN10740_c0_g1_i2.p1  ORF type:complete len:469 (+),score=86.75 TRINITY_DN10740_c0_g1_i2:256-1662(+)
MAWPEDERYAYFTRVGKVRWTEEDGAMIFVELPKLPGTIVVYRLPRLRATEPDKLVLSGRDLRRVPLFEGEEVLKMLDLSGNKLRSVERLVSLSSLLFLDLSRNRITIIDRLDGLPQLKVLLLGRNRISIVPSAFEELPCLEVLDLHANEIASLDDFPKLPLLRRLDLSQNRIDNKREVTRAIEKLPLLQELNLLMNPVSRDGFNPLRAPAIPSTERLNSEPIMHEETRPGNSKNDLEKVMQEYQANQRLVEQLEAEGRLSAKAIYKQCEVKQGIVAQKSEERLVIYGNGFDFLLEHADSLRGKLTCLIIEYYFFENLVRRKLIKLLRDFPKLRKLKLKHNNLVSFLQVSKLEAIPFLQELLIEENPVCQSTLLRPFIIYRFPFIQEVLSEVVTEGDRKGAKKIFQRFDKLLMRQDALRNSRDGADPEVIDTVYDKIVEKVETNYSKEALFVEVWQTYVKELIQKALH